MWSYEPLLSLCKLVLYSTEDCLNEVGEGAAFTESGLDGTHLGWIDWLSWKRFGRRLVIEAYTTLKKVNCGWQPKLRG